MAFWTYMLRCADDSFYVGHTDDLDRRISQHQSGYFTGYTFKRRPIELVWSEDFQTRLDALSAEKQIKGWRREKKQALMNGNWELMSQLSRTSVSGR